MMIYSSEPFKDEKERQEFIKNWCNRCKLNNNYCYIRSKMDQSMVVPFEWPDDWIITEVDDNGNIISKYSCCEFTDKRGDQNV